MQLLRAHLPLNLVFLVVNCVVCLFPYIHTTRYTHMQRNRPTGMRTNCIDTKSSPVMGGGFARFGIQEEKETRKEEIMCG